MRKNTRNIELLASLAKYALHSSRFHDVTNTKLRLLNAVHIQSKEYTTITL